MKEFTSRNRARPSFGLAAFLALGACSGRIAAEGTPTGSPPSEGQSSSSEAGVDASVSEESSTPLPVSEESSTPLPVLEGSTPLPEAGCPETGSGCGITAGPVHPLPTEADFVALFSRRWLTCGTPTFTGRADEAGFAAAADGTYTLLLYDASGTIVNGPQATYTIVPNQPPAWQVNFYPGPQAIFPGAIRITVATITDAPDSMKVADNGAIFWHFVAADPWPDDAGGSCP